LPEALIKVVAMVVEVVEAEAVKANEVKEVAIKIGANIEVKNAAIELEEEEVTITLIIDYYY
jgi:hypothetical protein